MTSFEAIYALFFSKITDDMYMEIEKRDMTPDLLDELLINAIPWFEFPRVSLAYDIETGEFQADLTHDEKNILATYMVIGWFDQQLASIELTRMKYTGSDFKMTSQANHMSKLLALKKDYERVGHKFQRLYKRRKTTVDGRVVSNMGSIMPTSARRGRVPAAEIDNPKDIVGWEDLITSVEDERESLKDAYTWRDLSDE